MQAAAMTGYCYYLTKGPEHPMTFAKFLTMLGVGDKEDEEGKAVAVPHGVEYDTASTPEEIMRRYGGRLPRKGVAVVPPSPKV